ncbi:MAG: hypothetical protein KY475_05120, partial [Planctomycetes bacterium]|nr:hypothetical protein [Planctomycetota bacterium]
MIVRAFCLTLMAGLAAGVAAAQEFPPAADPVMRFEGEGPAAYVTSLGFSRDGRTLFAGGLDKLIRAWRRDEDGCLHYAPDQVRRVP